MSANLRFRGPYARGPHDGTSLTYSGSASSLGTIQEENTSETLSLKQTVEALIKRVDAQDERIRHLEKHKEKSKHTILKMYRELAQQKRVLNVMETALLPYIKRLTEETELAIENRESGASSQSVSALGLNQRTRECMQGKSGGQVRKSNKGWFFNEDSSFIFKLFVASLAALMIYISAVKATNTIETWLNKVAYPLLDFGYNITADFVENTVASLFSNESDCMLCGTKDAVYSFAARAYSSAANVSAAIMEGAGV